MTISAQITALENDLDKLIERYRQEFDMPVACVVGTLTGKAHEIMENNLEEDGK